MPPNERVCGSTAEERRRLMRFSVGVAKDVQMFGPSAASDSRLTTDGDSDPGYTNLAVSDRPSHQARIYIQIALFSSGE